MSDMIVFILPYSKIGGADKVHLEIIRSINHSKRILVIFSSTDGNRISEEFREIATCLLVHTKLRKILLAFPLFILSHVFQITFFGCNSSYFYFLLPIISKKSKKIDLTHAFSFPDWGIENLAIKYVPSIDKRIVINKKTFTDYENQYRNEGINETYLNRFQIIPNAIEIKDLDLKKINVRFEHFKIGYVGRYAQEKRPELFLALATSVRHHGIKAKMLIDEFKQAKSEYFWIEIKEGITDPKILRNEFSEISVLIVPSLREGFPLVIMEAFELGIPVISTSVGSIDEHLIDGENGFISSNLDSEDFLNFCLIKLELLIKNKELYKSLSLSARQHALMNFDLENFRKSYKSLLTNE